MSLSETLNQHGVSELRLLATSKKIESLRADDRAVRLAKEKVRQGQASDQDKELAQRKPKSGRPVSRPTFQAALAGKKVSGAAKTRIVRALNHILVRKGKGEVSVRDLFSQKAKHEDADQG